MNSLKNATVLAIDEDPQILLSFQALLTNKCKELLLENDVESGFKLAAEKQPNLILLDISVNKMIGYEVCEQLKENQNTALIPVIFFSSLMRTADKVKSFEVGAAGYISKPLEKRRGSDLKDASMITQMTNIITQIESCLTLRPQHKQLLPTSSLKLIELLQQYHFKPREMEILRLYISGYKRSEIATHTYLSENTVKWYLRQLFQKLGVSNRAELIKKTSEFKI